MKICQAVLDAHAQFGGDLELMQKAYEWHDLKREVETLRSALSAQVQDVAGHEPFGAPGPDAMRVIDPDQWEPCSPDYLKRGGCCATAPRVWNAERLNHYHPKFPAAPAKQEIGHITSK